MKYEELINYFDSLDNKKDWKLGLNPVKKLLKKINNPQTKFKSIHVAGTNGKGSVCAMVSSILKESGFKVGLYTSPHLVDFRERFVINNKKISKKELVDIYAKIKPFIRKQTYFEIVTSIAFLYFYEKKVDFAVIEVGMGGRLDATNVIKPLVSIITNIGFEHTDYLGKTLTKIANEKSGIIKKNIPVVTGATGIALKSIKKKAKQKNAPFFSNLKKIIDYNPQYMKGYYQKKNVSIAIKTIQVLNNFYKLNINDANIKKGLEKAKWPGRFQFIERNILVDCAHNPDAFKILLNELKNLKYDKLILLIGLMKDKDIKKIINMLNDFVDYFIITQAKTKRASEPELIAKFVKKKFTIIRNSNKAFRFAKKIANKNDLILVAGSIYLVGEIYSKNKV